MLKNIKIGILVGNPQLENVLNDFFLRLGANVFFAEDDEVIERMHQIIGFELALISVEPIPPKEELPFQFGLN